MVEFLGENICGKLLHISLGNFFFNMTTKNRQQKQEETPGSTSN